ncbi:unnamed protein product [Rotaria socialis]|uniref:Uncharacterized protein n=1 Tax=Rotaria socialis TaxID=392032 RepID=A0A820RG11_9BILA|nr:unnamed protein product [Rotaria socialis]CAF4435833.1 unnamed protein product [Rotaria socialis]CAF4624777.1 unnamed protein product [Rotaria socialis]CAF4635288.1 unnamed protein product [Rotaria socialis]
MASVKEVPNLEKILSDFLDNRKEIISAIMETAKRLDDQNKSVNITKVVTGSTGIAGTIISVAGIVLAIPTLGMSLPFAIGGAALAATSGAAHLGSDITNRILTKSHLTKLDALCQADESNLLKLADYLKQMIKDIQNNQFDDKTDFRTAGSVVEGIAGVANLTCSIIRVTQAASVSIRTVQIAGAASAVMGKKSKTIIMDIANVHILGVVTLPFQIIDLAISAQALHENKVCETSAKLRELAKNLEIQADNVAKFIFERINQIH